MSHEIFAKGDPKHGVESHVVETTFVDANIEHRHIVLIAHGRVAQSVRCRQLPVSWYEAIVDFRMSLSLQWYEAIVDFRMSLSLQIPLESFCI